MKITTEKERVKALYDYRFLSKKKKKTVKEAQKMTDLALSIQEYEIKLYPVEKVKKSAINKLKKSFKKQ